MPIYNPDTGQFELTEQEKLERERQRQLTQPLVGARSDVGMPMARPEPGVQVVSQPVRPTSQPLVGARSDVGMPMARPEPGVQVVGQNVRPQQPQPQPQPEKPFVMDGIAYIGRYSDIQDDPSELLNLYKDTNAPQFLRERAGSRVADILTNQRNEQQAQQQLSTLTPKQVSDIAQGRVKTGVGDWMQYLLFKHVGLKDLANEKAEQLGIGQKWTPQSNEQGEQALIKYSASGMPLEGYDTSGRPLTREQLFQYGGMGGTKLDIVGGTYINDKTGEVGRVVTDERTGRSVIQTDTGRKPLTGFRPQSSQGSLTDMRARQLQELNLKLQGKTEEEKMAILRPYNQQLRASGYPEISPQEVGITAPQIGTTPPAAPAPAVVSTQPQTQPQQRVQPTQAPAPSQAPTTGTTVSRAEQFARDQERGRILQTELDNANARLQQTTDPVQRQRIQSDINSIQNEIRGLPGQRRPTGPELELRKQEQTAQLKITTERSESLNKILDDEVRPQASAGDTVSSVRKQQFAMFNRPDVDMSKIFGLATGVGSKPGDQRWTILRDIFSGRVASNADGTPMNGDQLSQRLAGLNLTPNEQSVLAEYNISNARINAATLKETAGPGSVTNVEQQMNRERNVDITRLPALAAYNAMAQSQFDGDRARYKADWASSRTFNNALEMDREWRKESKRLADIYMDIARKRVEFITKNGSTTNAVKEGYRRFPIPEYDPNAGAWKKTKPLTDILGR